MRQGQYGVATEVMIKDILEEAKRVDLTKIIDPKSRVVKKSAVRGVMSDLEKRLYCIICQQEQFFGSICAEYKGKNVPRHQYNPDNIKCLMVWVAQVSWLMWGLIRLRFGLGHMVIREGFRVEFIESDKPGTFVGIDFGSISNFPDKRLRKIISDSGFKI